MEHFHQGPVSKKLQMCQLLSWARFFVVRKSWKDAVVGAKGFFCFPSLASIFFRIIIGVASNGAARKGSPFKIGYSPAVRSKKRFFYQAEM